MEAVMRRRPAVGLPWRRGDQWGATPATFAGQERAAGAFERTARPRLVNADGCESAPPLEATADCVNECGEAPK